MPDLTPYETSLYLFLLRHARESADGMLVRIGKRSIAAGLGTGPRSAQTNFGHVTKMLCALEQKGCLRIGDATRDGTAYVVLPLRDIPSVRAKLSAEAEQKQEPEEDHFTDPARRRSLYERDTWTCAYCGERVTADNATLDHYVPQSKGGQHTRDNLKTCCFVCNSIKSGKSYEEAAPLLLKSMRERMLRRQ